MEQPAYSIGESVIYGSNGICEIADIRRDSPVAGAKPHTYYVLSQKNCRGLTISVPADNAMLMARMRRLMSREEIETLLTGARGRDIEWIEDRRERAERFRNILSGGVHDELILMIRCIYLHRRDMTSKGKKLNVTDDDTLKAAEKLVREEFATALEIDPASVGSYIRSRLNIREK